MRLVGYRCEKCGELDEELFNDTEKKPKILKRKCKCGGKLIQYDIKQNCHRWNYNDRPL
jgi:predicted  nucleic acid-binding Zn-ribbon protein